MCPSVKIVPLRLSGFDTFVLIEVPIAMKFLFAILLLIVVTAPGISQDPTPADCQFSAIVQADGHEEEWPMKWLEDEDKKFYYNACLDASNLYVRLKVMDELTRRKLALFGLTLWLDPNGKKKKKLGLHFPTGAEAKEVMEQYRLAADENVNMTASQRVDFQRKMEKALIENLEMMELIGLTDEPLTSTRSGITNGLKVALAQNEEGAYVYEAVIPLRAFRLSRASVSSLGVGFETGHYVPAKEKPKAGTTTNSATAPGQTSDGSYGTRFSAANMGRGQGYQGAGANTPMSYSAGFWTAIKLK